MVSRSQVKCAIAYLNAVLSPFIAESLGHLQYTSFGGCIGRDIRHGHKGSERGDVDDFPGSAKFDQLHPELLSGYVRSFQIDGEDLIECQYYTL